LKQCPFPSSHRCFPALITLLAVLAPILHAADWYVSPAGSDSGAGTQGDPFATFEHAVSVSGSSDTINFRRGGTYFASGVSSGGRDLEAYGTGAEPVITGSIQATLPGTWTSDSNVLTGPVADRVAACFVDGRFVRLARWPNAEDGFLRIDNDNSPKRIIDSELSSRPGVTAGRWTGAVRCGISGSRTPCACVQEKRYDTGRSLRIERVQQSPFTVSIDTGQTSEIH
jgi:hypothetical protein